MYPGEVIMKKVELRMNEQNKYEIIKKLVETDENKKRAATNRKPMPSTGAPVKKCGSF